MSILSLPSEPQLSLRQKHQRAVERRLDLHRRSCLTGYLVKIKRVEEGKGKHKFIHPIVP